MSRVAKSAKTAVTPSVDEKNKTIITIELNEYFLLYWGLFEIGVTPHGDGDLKTLNKLVKLGLMERSEKGSFHTFQHLKEKIKKITNYLARER